MRGSRPSEGGPDPVWSGIGLVPAALFVWFVSIGLFRLLVSLWRAVFRTP